jgi:hypothetical protein
MKGGILVKLIRMNISVPAPLKAKLDALRTHGTTACGFIRAVVERELNRSSTTRQRGR